MKIFTAITLFYLLIPAAYGADSSLVKVGMPAPTFSLPDLEYKYVALRDFCGDQLNKAWLNKTRHVVVISFFATWCKPCLAEIKQLEEIAKEVTDRPVKFLLIDVGEKREVLVEFLKQHPIGLPILLDRYQKVAEKYDALTLPRLFIADRYGIIRYEQKGLKDSEDFKAVLRDSINELLQE